MRMHLKAGFRWLHGRLTKGLGRLKVDAIPSARMLSKSGDPDFNPRVHAFAIRIGAEFVRDNRYRFGDEYVDRNGLFVPGPNDECQECAGAPWHVRIPVRDAWGNPIAGRFTSTYCRRCVSQEEVEDARQRQNTYSGKQARGVKK